MEKTKTEERETRDRKLDGMERRGVKHPHAERGAQGERERPADSR